MTGRAPWILSLGLGALWLSANHYFLWRLSRSAGLPGSTTRSVLVPLIFKFPVLYVAGALIFFAPGFKIQGVIVAFTAYLAVAALLLAVGRLDKSGRAVDKKGT